ncbi:MAG: zinc ribbon domain-containing protein [Halobacteriota archaeon]|uniref:zinc ribbon domain-containing protein n=1 Tax=Natronomonas sp. TaxID=2184060 RepID=UPI003974FB69
MPSCRNCGTDLAESARFCPSCATPQTEEASRRLSQFINERAQQSVGGDASGDDGVAADALRHRAQYALGYLGVVAGLSTLLAGAGVFFLLAGLFVLPPVQALLESRLGRSIGPRPTAAATAALFAVGTAAFVAV